MKKILHLSDTHWGSEHVEIPLDVLVDRLIAKVQDRHHYIVVHTGDLVDNAFEESSLVQARLQLDRLKDAGFEVLIVPGNHDYGNGSLGSADCVPKYKEVVYGNAKEAFPKVDIVGEIAFVGLDTMADELHWYDALFAEGELGVRQLDRLNHLLCFDKSVAEAKYRVVYLHHHPFHPRPFHYLKDTDALQAVLSEHRIDALLFGHNHEGESFHGSWGIERVYDGGSSTGKKSAARAVRVIDLSLSPECDEEWVLH